VTRLPDENRSKQRRFLDFTENPASVNRLGAGFLLIAVSRLDLPGPGHWPLQIRHLAPRRRIENSLRIWFLGRRVRHNLLTGNVLGREPHGL
jgi:hypothetical protein